MTDQASRREDRWGGGGRRLTWKQLRARMVGDDAESSRPRLRLVRDDETPPAPPPAAPADGGYAELHAHSYFSFLDGASSPEELVAEATRLGLAGLAITDHNGFYGAVRFAEAARRSGLAAVYGAELSLDAVAPRTGVPDPEATHLLVLARGAEGYRRLSEVIGQAHLDGGRKGLPVYDLDDLAARLRGHSAVLTGCRKGAVRKALTSGGARQARRELDRLVEAFGSNGVVAELFDHGDLVDAERNQTLVRLADDAGLPVAATNVVHYARPSEHRLAQVAAAVRAGKPLAELDGWLHPSPSAHLRSAAEMRRRLGGFGDAVAHTVRLAEELAFDFDLVAPALPAFDVPSEHDEDSWLRHLACEGARRRYGPRAEHPKAYARLEHELALVEELKLAGYFLTVAEIVNFCADNDILVQGRGSAACSVVCYSLGITAVDPIDFNLLFERFLSPFRDGFPDIDLDIEARRREEVIQHVYEKYNRTHAAQVANVICYRRRSAVRDVAAALGYSPGQADAWNKASVRGSRRPPDLPDDVADYAVRLFDAPRHLGIHSGGMVIADRPVSQICPVEWATMPGRTVLQWDKDSVNDAGLVKIDLLAIGMLTALKEAAALTNSHYTTGVDLAKLTPKDSAVYQMIHEGDSIGLFQIESRAQIQLAPRLNPENIYDLAVQIALVRPGPIQGNAVHPYIRRKRGEEPVSYPHKLMRRALARTYGVGLFQEQMMELARDCAGFSPAQADELRQAMAAKRSAERMLRLKHLLYQGMRDNGIVGKLADDVYAMIEAFAGYGFPESHSLSFAYLAYASGCLKRYYPAAFLAGMIRAQPCGFYSVNTLIGDARRHGVTVLGVDVNKSAATTGLAGYGAPSPADAPSADWGRGGPAVRLGLDQIRGVNAEAAERIAAAAPYAGVDDLARRAELAKTPLEHLAEAGALAELGLTRRQAMWVAAPAARNRPDTLPLPTAEAPTLPGMSDVELTAADIRATGSSPDTHPFQHVRDKLHALDVVPINRLPDVPDGRKVAVAGLVTHRQAPETAGGMLFVNLEDETGHANITVTPGLRAAHPAPAHTAPALLVVGRLHHTDGAPTVTAEKLTPLRPPGVIKSRDFQ